MDPKAAIDRLERNGRIFQDLLGGHSPEQARWKPDADRWSLLEVLGHLIDIEREDFRYDLEITLFRPGEPWPSFDIEAWVTERNYNGADLADSLEKLRAERDASIAWLAGLGAIDPDAVHSGNGFRREPMRAGDILASWLAHDLFHIRQIARLGWDLLNRDGAAYSPAYSGYEDA